MEIAQSAAGRRNARKVRKHKRAAAFSFFLLPAMSLSVYMPLAWHSEVSLDLKSKSREQPKAGSSHVMVYIEPFDLRRSDSSPALLPLSYFLPSLVAAAFALEAGARWTRVHLKGNAPAIRRNFSNPPKTMLI
jgi:hypothetical protein